MALGAKFGYTPQEIDEMEGGYIQALMIWLEEQGEKKKSMTPFELRKDIKWL